MIHRTAYRSAFTLLEMLVALALVGVIAGSLYASLHIGFRAHESVTTSIQPVRRAELAARLIRDDITAAVPASGPLTGEFVGRDAVSESGRAADVLVFYSSANVPGADERACDIRRVELTCEPLDGDGRGRRKRAIVRRVTTRLLAPETPIPRADVLCRGVGALNVRYHDGGGWLDSWDSAAREGAIPAAVEVRIELEKEEPDDREREPYVISRVFSIARTGSSQAQQPGMIRSP